MTGSGQLLEAPAGRLRRSLVPATDQLVRLCHHRFECVEPTVWAIQRPASLTRAARPEQNREQKRRFLAPFSAQNSAPHHSHTTTMPRPPQPGCERLASRTSGDIWSRWPDVRRSPLPGSRAATKRVLTAKVRRAFSMIVSRVTLATSPPRRERP